MTVDPTVVPGLLLLVLELLALGAIGYVVARVALRQSNDLLALAQGMVIGPSLWGLIVNFALHLLPGRAGALAGWLLLLALTAGLVLRDPHSIRLQLRPTLAFMATAVAVFWVALAARQTLSIPDPENHLGLASQMQVGGYPPAFPWNPELLAAYHHGFDLLVGLLAPPFGPDLALTTELLGAYVWVCVVMALGAALLKLGGWVSLLVLAPLAVGPGLWTLVDGPPDDLLRVPLPAGFPGAGLRASLADIYWPPVELAWSTPLEAVPPDIWKPNFKFSHVLAFVVVERLVHRAAEGWTARLTLAGLVGFLGLVDESVAVIVVGLWLAVEMVRVLRDVRLAEASQAADSRRTRWLPYIAWADLRSIWNGSKSRALSAAVGPGLAMALLVVGGGAITGVLIGPSDSGLSLGWIADVWQRRPLGSFEFLAGGIGLLGLGIVPAALGSAWLARRSNLVIALALGSCMSLLLALILQYAHGQHDIARFDGHGRFFALMALLLALAARLRRFQLPGRILAGAALFVLATLPTVGGPLRMLGVVLGHGPHVANAAASQQQVDRWEFNRYVLGGLKSQLVTDYIRRHTKVDDRILSPDPNGMSIATGRPNASGLVGLLHFSYFAGPEYLDAKLYLEPAALRRLEIDYVHATDSWIRSLPESARRSLENPGFFELVIRDGQDSLYRVMPAFLSFDPAPTPDSYEALRRAVPAGSIVYLAPGLGLTIPVHMQSVLSHAQISTQPVGSYLHLRMNIDSEPLGTHLPDFVALSAQLAPVALNPRDRSPVWLSEDKDGAVAVYSTGGVTNGSVSLESNFDVRLSNVTVDGKQITFTATFTDRASERWTGHDWIVSAVDDSPWNLPHQLLPDQRTFAGTQWYGGQVAPGSGTTVVTYMFDAHAGRLGVRGASNEFSDAPSSDRPLHPGAWTLLARLRRDHLEAALIPIMTITMTEAGGVSYEIYDGNLSAFVDACPSYLSEVATCRPVLSKSVGSELSADRQAAGTRP